MLLSNREIEVISSLAKGRRYRVLSLWILAAAILLAVAASFYIDYDLTVAIVMLGGFLGGQAAAYSSYRSDELLIEIVQRYVNDDPEALRQIAARSSDDAG